MKSRFGIDVAIHQFDGQIVKTLASTLAGTGTDAAAVRRALSGETVIQQGELGGRPTAIAFGRSRAFPARLLPSSRSFATPPPIATFRETR